LIVGQSSTCRSRGETAETLVGGCSEAVEGRQQQIEEVDNDAVAGDWKVGVQCHPQRRQGMRKRAKVISVVLTEDQGEQGCEEEVANGGGTGSTMAQLESNSQQVKGGTEP
jgi:hypothetical protein